jgi:DNA-binding transcriptional LysR family regulator
MAISPVADDAPSAPERQTRVLITPWPQQIVRRRGTTGQIFAVHQLIEQVDHMAIELRHMQYFVAVAEQLSFRRAAERLFISQPTLSHQIAKFEKTLGIRLLDRDRRHVELTDAGAVFLERARQILSEADQAVAQARWAGGLTGTGLRIGCATRNSRNVWRLLETFRQSRPDVWLDEHEMDTAAQVNGLHTRTLDVGLVYPPVDASLAVQPLSSQELVVAVPSGHRLAQLEEVPLRELVNEPILMLHHRSFFKHYGYVTALCRLAGFKPEIAWLDQSGSFDLHAALSMVAIGRGLSLLSMSWPQAPPPGVAFRLLRPPRPQYELVMAWRPDELSPLVRTFIEVSRNLTLGTELAEP